MTPVWTKVALSVALFLGLAFAGVLFFFYLPMLMLLPAVGLSTNTEYTPWTIDMGGDETPKGAPFVPDPNAPDAWPLPGGWITSSFGPRVHPITRQPGFHHGVDIGAADGTPVLVARAGRVVHAGWAMGYGVSVSVSHGDGRATVYGHLSSALVRRGDTVAAGQEIGRVGSTGMSTGPHLHFEMRVNGKAVDPLATYREATR